jgi:hypothetical protein
MYALIISTVALRAILNTRKPTPTPSDQLPLLTLFASIGSKTTTAQFTQFLLIHRMNRTSISDPKPFTSVPTHLSA